MSDRLILEAWSAAADAGPVLRPALLCASLTDTDPYEARRLPIAERDRRLLEGRARLFGREVAGRATCPVCAASLEYRFTATSDPPADVMVDGRTIAGPSTDDLLDALRSPDPHALLAERTVGTLPSEARPAALAALEEAHDSFATLDLDCEPCGHRWQVELDVGSLLWRELSVAAQRLMGEVTMLARAFGWSEAAILDLGRARRQAYLALAGQ